MLVNVHLLVVILGDLIGGGCHLPQFCKVGDDDIFVTEQAPTTPNDLRYI